MATTRSSSRMLIIGLMVGIGGLLVCISAAGIGAFLLGLGPFQAAPAATPTQQAVAQATPTEEAAPTATATQESIATATSTETPTHTATATATGTPTRTATPTVTPQPDPVIYSFTADPAAVYPGDPSTLSWNCEFAFEGVELNGSGVPCPGSSSVRPSSTTTYNLVAHGSLGRTATASVIVTVNPPVTHSTGPLSIPQTFSADLDEGAVVGDPARDIWFEAVTATERYVTPKNSSTIAIVGTGSVGRYGCATASLSGSRINVNDLPVGTYACIRTNLGRYSQFRVNAPIGPSPGTLTIGYTTWE